MRFPWIVSKYHAAAKAGDREAADRLAGRMLNPEKVKALAEWFDKNRPVRIAYPHAREAAGRNKIPVSMASQFQEAFRQLGFTDVKRSDGIVQTTAAGHTGAGLSARIARPALFEGSIERGVQYLVLDDVTTAGDTLLNLAGYIADQGGVVTAVTALAGGKGTPKRLAADPETIQLIRQTYGQQLEQFLQAVSDHGIETLSPREAGFIAAHARRGDSFERLRDRILAERFDSGGQGVRGVSEGQPPIPGEGDINFARRAEPEGGDPFMIGNSITCWS